MTAKMNKDCEDCGCAEAKLFTFWPAWLCETCSITRDATTKSNMTCRLDEYILRVLLTALDWIAKGEMLGPVQVAGLAQALRRSCGDESTFDEMFCRLKPYNDDKYGKKLNKLAAKYRIEPLKDEDSRDGLYWVAWIDHESGKVSTSDETYPLMAALYRISCGHYHHRHNDMNETPFLWPAEMPLPVRVQLSESEGAETQESESEPCIVV